MLNFKHIEAFVTVSDLGSFRRAADRLNTTQPNISSRIAQLEFHLGVTLMERDAGSVRLTQKGKSLLGPARSVLAAMDGQRSIDAETAEAAIEWTHFKTNQDKVLRGAECVVFDRPSGLIREIRAYLNKARPGTTHISPFYISAWFSGMVFAEIADRCLKDKKPLTLDNMKAAYFDYQKAIELKPEDYRFAFRFAGGL